MSSHRPKLGPICALALAAILGLGLTAHAQDTPPAPPPAGPEQMPPPRMSGPMGGHMGPAMAALSPQKQEALKNIMQAHQEAVAPVHQQLIAKHGELNAQVFGQNPDDQKIAAIIKEIGELDAMLLQAQVNMQRQLLKAGLPPIGPMTGVPMSGAPMGSGSMGHMPPPAPATAPAPGN